jgi:hypothetical protein
MNIMKTTQRVWLLILCVSFLLLIQPGAKPALGQTKDSKETKTPPVELTNIRIEYAVGNASGRLSWESPNPEKPNEIPAGAQKLRFKANVTNRPAGSKIRLRAALQELCSSPDAGKPFLARLRHLTDTEQDVEVSKPDKEVSIELPVHCEDCVHAVCGCECPDKDHLGEGPHLTTLTASDTTAAKNTTAAKPASVRMEIRTVCPKKCVKSGSE